MSRAAASRLACAAAICVAALAALVLMPCGHEPCEDRMMAFVVDRPIVTYSEYKALMLDGEVDIVRDGMTAHIVKSEMGWHWLQRLSILVKAE